MNVQVVTTLVMALGKNEPMPKKGETRIMAGSFGTNYAVTVHRVTKVEEGEHYRYMTVRATRRAITPDATEARA